MPHPRHWQLPNDLPSLVLLTDHKRRFKESVRDGEETQSCLDALLSSKSTTFMILGPKINCRKVGVPEKIPAYFHKILRFLQRYDFWTALKNIFEYTQ